MADNGLNRLKEITVLYAEDEESLRSITTNILGNFVKKLIVAEDGQQGLEFFKKNSDEIDMVITDINMPNMNGLDMAKEIKVINANMPVILTTAFSNTEYLLKAIDLGIDKYVLKPVDIKKLIEVISKSLLYHELRDLYLDRLTMLSNRNKLIKDLRATTEDMMVLFDIDEFSAVNDLYGEEVGDKILIEFSDRLKAKFPKEEYNLYRLGGDKYAVTVKDLSENIEDFEKKCKNFIDEIEKNHFKIDDVEIDINVTAGLTLSEFDKAYGCTQKAVNYAREKFLKITKYKDGMYDEENYRENLMWIKKLKTALDDKKFVAYFQPIVDLQSGQTVKYESLIRYMDETEGAVSPVKFLHIAKHAKIFPEIIKVMLNQAFGFIKEKKCAVAVNISFDDISEQSTIDDIMKILESNKDLLENLHFEILESEEIKDFKLVIGFINTVKDLGCSVGVDDFGAGYSNFNMLMNLNVDYVKIDGSLISEIDKEESQEIITTSIVEFSKKLGIKTIAEFVGSEDIYNKVKGIGVDLGQGYYFDKPLAFSEVK
jgi:diguanylate cyclase (GGDEF)-like protein